MIYVFMFFIYKVFDIICFIIIFIILYKYRIKAKKLDTLTKNKNMLYINDHEIKRVNNYKIPIYLQLLLSDRQVIIFQLMLNRHTNKEIADILDKSENSINRSICAISKKVGIKGKTELLKWYLDTYQNTEDDE